MTNMCGADNLDLPEVTMDFLPEQILALINETRRYRKELTGDVIEDRKSLWLWDEDEN